MEEIIRFATLAASGRFTMTELCADFGISRKTGYKQLRRCHEGRPAKRGQLADMAPSLCFRVAGLLRSCASCNDAIRLRHRATLYSIFRGANFPEIFCPVHDWPAA